MERKKLIYYGIGLFLIACFIFLPGYSELQKLRENNEEYEQRIRLLEERNEDLKQELVQMREDPEYLEKKARQKFGIVKKGEILYKKQVGL